MKSICSVLVLVTGLFFMDLSAQELQKSIAILDLTERNNESNDARLFSAIHIAGVTGIPYIVTDDPSEAVSYGMILNSSLINNNTFSLEEKTLLYEYVNGGGLLVTPRLQSDDLFSLFGVDGYENSNSRYVIHWDSTLLDESLVYIDEPEERTLSLGRSTYDAIFKTLGYATTTASTLAYFADGSSAVIKNNYGQGAAVSIGVSWKEVILRNQLNRDYEAHRIASNGFEPTSDVLALFVRGLFMEHHPYTVWKNTSPGNSSATLMITHDIDSSTGMDTLEIFVDYESENDIEATYNVTVKYVDDALAPPYYLGRQSTLEYIINHDQNIASHSVGHFFDFADSDIFPIGTPGNTRDNYRPSNDGTVSTGGTVYGECEVSKNILEADIDGLSIRTFRAGHLAYPDYLVDVLEELGYAYNSTYSASDVLNNFPYLNKKGRSFSGASSTIYEIPVTISDVFHDDPISAINIFDKADTWLDITLNNLENGAPTTLLIHPNRHYKLAGLQYYLDRVPEELHIMEMEKFGDFWKARTDLGFTTEVVDDEMIIRLTSEVDLDQGISFIVTEGQILSDISIVDEAGSLLPFIIEDRGEQDVVVYYEDIINSVVEQTSSISEAQLQIYPNPTHQQLQIISSTPLRGNLRIYDQHGRVVLERDFKDELELDLSSVSNGVYTVYLKSLEGVWVERMVKVD